MARTITIEIKADTKQAEREIQEFGRKVKTALDPVATNIGSFRSSVSGLSVGFAALAVAGVAAMKQIGERALEAAKRIDQAVNTLKALTGSAQAAEQRFAALFALAQKTPGLTTSLALTLDTTLRILNVTEKTIDRLLPVIGRLNAIAPLGDPRQFANNLAQLVTQGFERQDLKELVGNSPFAGEIIKSLFNVDSPTNAKAIREAAGKLGIKTFEDFAVAFVKAAESDTRLQAVTESIATRFEKLQDRLDVALAGLGREIAKTILPIFEDLVKATEIYGEKAAEIFRDNRSDILSIVRSVETLIGRFGDLVNAIFSLASNAKVGLGGLKQEFEDLASIFAFLTDVSEGNIFTRPRTLALTREQEAGRGSPFLESPIRQLNAPAITPPIRPPRPTGGGTSERVSRAAKERAREIKDLTEKIARERDEFGQGNVEDLEAILKSINAANLGTETGLRSDRLKSQRESRLALTADFERREDLAKQFEKSRKELEKIKPVLSESERFMKGFTVAVNQAGDAFENFGENVAFAFRNVRDLFNGLKTAVLGFFNDLLGSALQNLVRQTLGPLLGGLGGGGGGILGNLFRTPSFAGGGGGGGGITTPPSISLGPFGFGNGFGISTGASARADVGGFVGSSVPLTAGVPRFSFSGLGRSFAAAAPFLGASLGGSIGGRSTAGNILGSAGGFLTGGFLAATLAPGIFSGAAAGLLTNPFTAIAGVGLLVGGALLGKKKQRQADEELSGQMLTQALSQIRELKSGIDSGSIDGSQARAIFENQILAQFISGINSLKTESVRRSRLTNQVADLRRVFNELIEPSIAAQSSRSTTSSANALAFSRQIPQFASGGTTRGGLALLHPGEKVLNQAQQASVIRQSNPQVFERAGVPGVQHSRVFENGGIMPSGGGPAIVIDNLNVVISKLGIGESEATAIATFGVNTERGRRVIVNQVNVARKNREL